MTDVCREIEPPLTDYDGHLAACHHPLNVSKDEVLRAGAAAESPESAPRTPPRRSPPARNPTRSPRKPLVRGSSL